jgi:nicotinamide-nucleotide amidase
MPAANVKQATLIPSATAISNPVGSAPGWWVSGKRSDGDERLIVSMPGVPYEMKLMWEREVEPQLRSRSSSVIVSRTLKIMGLGESRVAEMVGDLMEGSNPTLAPYAKSDGVHLRITAKTATTDEAAGLIAHVENEVRSRLGDAVYGVDDETPVSIVGRLLDGAHLTFVLVEIGSGALGTLGSQLGTHTLCSGVLGELSIELAAAKLECTLTGSSGKDLATVAESARRRYGADIAVAVSVEVEPLDDQEEAVTFRAEVFVVEGPGEKDKSLAEYSWRATLPEVNRLVGLAALNHLRHRLLAIGRRNGRVIAV